MAGKRSQGRPTAYRVEYDKIAYRLCLLGSTDAELGEAFGVTEQTINGWKQKHPNFFESITRGKRLADAKVAESMFKRACGYKHKAVKIMQNNGEPIIVPYTERYPPDTNAGSLWLRNRQRALWSNNPNPAGGDDDIPPTMISFEVEDGRTRPDSATEA